MGRRRSLNISWFLLLALVLTFFLVAHVASRPLHAQSGPAASQQRLEQLATLSGRSPQSLVLADSASFVLPDRRQVEQVKALDLETGEVLGAAFVGDAVVDVAQARAAAAAQWRAEHGALTPESVQRLAQLPSGARVNLALWLSVDVDALPRPAAAPVGSEGEAATGSGPPPTAAPEEKVPAPALPPEEVPPEVLAQLQAQTGKSPPTTAEAGKPEAEMAAAERTNVNRPGGGLSAAEREAYQVANEAHLRDQLAPAQASVRARLAGLGLNEATFSEGTPLVYVPAVARAEVEMIATWPELDAIYLVPDTAGPSLSHARPTQNADLLESVGYDGNGSTVAVVEGERAFFANPYLSLAGTFDGSRPFAAHPTGVAGIIRSTHPTERGLAPAATVYSANGDYADWGVMSNAINWGAGNAETLNNSWYWDWNNNPAMWAADRQLDYVVRNRGDFVTVAAGNFGNGCGSNFTTYVASPAKGYNVLSVGNYDDRDSLNWSDDVMNTCSSFGDPGADASTPTHEKPEVAAVGTTINSTLISLDPAAAVGPIGSGTSYASPMVAALASTLIQADGGLAVYPEAVRAVIMATALHNIEGSARLSDVDGVGGIVASAAMASVERGHWDGSFVTSSSSFPINYHQHAYAGERVRFVITWDANPTSDYTSDPLPADLDLRAYRADGTTLVASSASIANNFEIVDFIAPATETYIFRISRFGSWTGGGTYLGVGWWRGSYRILPNTGYPDSPATPLGTHLTIRAADWPYFNYWRALGIRSRDSDHDLRLDAGSWFDDPSARNLLAASGSTAPVDYVVVDGNHRDATLLEHYRVNRFGGTGGYDVGWSSTGTILSTPGVYGPYSLSITQPLRIFEVRFTGGGRRYGVFPTGGGADLGLELFRSSASTPSTWTRGKGQGVAQANAWGVGTAVEQLSYRSTAGQLPDWLGLVVYNQAQSATTFFVVVESLDVYLPLVRR